MQILEKLEITPETLGLLLFIKLNTSSTDYVRDIIKEYLFEFTIPDTEFNFAQIFEQKGWIKYVKTGRKDPWHRIRLSDKGEQILKDLNNKPKHELADFMLEYIKSEYKRIGADNNYIKGGDKLLNYISEFLYHKAVYTEKMIKAVITSYVEQYQYDKKYLSKMDNLIFKPSNAYATKWTKEDSPLCIFIDANQDKIRYNFTRLI